MFFSLTMQCFADVFEKPSTSMFLAMFLKTQNIVPTMLIAHPYGESVRHSFRFPLCQCLWPPQSVGRPWDVTYFVKALTNRFPKHIFPKCIFQGVFFKVYFPKCIFQSVVVNKTSSMSKKSNFPKSNFPKCVFPGVFCELYTQYASSKFVCSLAG